MSLLVSSLFFFIIYHLPTNQICDFTCNYYFHQVLLSYMVLSNFTSNTKSHGVEDERDDFNEYWTEDGDTNNDNYRIKIQTAIPRNSYRLYEFQSVLSTCKSSVPSLDDVEVFTVFDSDGKLEAIYEESRSLCRSMSMSFPLQVECARRTGYVLMAVVPNSDRFDLTDGSYSRWADVVYPFPVVLSSSNPSQGLAGSNVYLLNDPLRVAYKLHRRWCVLDGHRFSYYKSGSNTTIKESIVLSALLKLASSSAAGDDRPIVSVSLVTPAYHPFFSSSTSSGGTLRASSTGGSGAGVVLTGGDSAGVKNHNTSSSSTGGNNLSSHLLLLQLKYPKDSACGDDRNSTMIVLVFDSYEETVQWETALRSRLNYDRASFSTEK